MAAQAANSLSAPLKEAAGILNDGNLKNDKAACGKLDAFINQVNARAKSGELTPAQSGQLVDAAKAIETSLGC